MSGGRCASEGRVSPPQRWAEWGAALPRPSRLRRYRGPTQELCTVWRGASVAWARATAGNGLRSKGRIDQANGAAPGNVEIPLVRRPVAEGSTASIRADRRPHRPPVPPTGRGPYHVATPGGGTIHPHPPRIIPAHASRLKHARIGDGCRRTSKIDSHGGSVSYETGNPDTPPRPAEAPGSASIVFVNRTGTESRRPGSRRDTSLR
jgi:hypothetical protein